MKLCATFKQLSRPKCSSKSIGWANERHFESKNYCKETRKCQWWLHCTVNVSILCRESSVRISIFSQNCFCCHEALSRMLFIYRVEPQTLLVPGSILFGDLRKTFFKAYQCQCNTPFQNASSCEHMEGLYLIGTKSIWLFFGVAIQQSTHQIEKNYNCSLRVNDKLAFMLPKMWWKSYGGKWTTVRLN